MVKINSYAQYCITICVISIFLIIDLCIAHEHHQSNKKFVPPGMNPDKFPVSRSKKLTRNELMFLRNPIMIHKHQNVPHLENLADFIVFLFMGKHLSNGSNHGKIFFFFIT